ncbi:MAG TPA: T9SS type A sorting domain-containing protein [Bacteroidia bacterium]|jgi:hypothetical protein|nr:T9SS type A sorting domain-containing protein [Bacteroidia bacterium]
MKNLLIAISMLFCVGGAKAQLTYEHTYDTGSYNYTTGYGLRIIHFSSLGYKYVMVNPDNLHGMVEIYNLNHSLYKQFAIPPQPLSASNPPLIVEYVSDSLFNNNSSDIEYLMEYSDVNSTGYVKVYNDAGSLIFSKDSVCFGGDGGLGGPNDFPYTEPVFYTPNGYKIILNDSYGFSLGSKAYVYGLPGALPCSECSNSNLITSIQPLTQGGSGSLLNAYPNPAKNSTTIKYELPNGANQGEIIFYDLQGRQVKSFTVDRTFDSLLVSTADLATGTYFYILRANGNYVGSKKMVIIK